ncbi:unnamed protein product [Phytophthora fragariaefolia]|uniref:Unnamed protein product n=1 Tax=Phytophthora fragariaefolia TaxID=1490495 RepID=A0A9W6YFH0_9STRA|nr:unnamed protein product [Phytophthora fragariaefolia]
MLRTLSPTEQHGVALGFIMKEQRKVAARATVSTPSTPRVESLKLHVNSYVGREGSLSPLSCRSRQARAEFLDLQQGKHDVHAYAQRARYLVSTIVTNPIDEAPKVVTFMKGLKAGLVMAYLFREYPRTLEAAVTLAMQEEFSLRQAKLHVNDPRQIPRPTMKPTGGPEPMELLSAMAAGPQQRCGRYGGDYTAPVHAAKGRRDDTGYCHGQ